MGNPSGSRGEAAYARAMAAFQEGSLDVAKRLVTEALADDPHHPGARALRTRIESRLSSGGHSGSGRSPMGRGSAPEATSVDPTILIQRAVDRPPDYVEPTVMIQREDLPRPRAERQPDPYRAPSSSRSPRSAPAPEPTILIPPKKEKRTPASSSSSPSFLQLLWLRLRGGDGASATRRPGKSASSGRQAGSGVSASTRGVLLVVAGLAVAALFVYGVVAFALWIWPSGNMLTVERPIGGTLVGSGVSCGSRGADCSVKISPTETVDLQPVPDSGYMFTGYTKDCAPSGRVLMSQARTCGANFSKPTAGGEERLTWPLTITKPTGGTVVEASGIACGTAHSECTKNLPDGAVVTLMAEPDKDFHFVAYIGDCGVSGQITMTGPKTCGANFAPGAIVVPLPEPDRNPTRRTTKTAPQTTPESTPRTQPNVPSPPPPTPAQPPTTQPPPVPPTVAPVVVETKPVEAPETEEAHAKKEILQLVKNYCAELETMNPERIQKIFPLADVRTLREQYRQYKSLQCSLTGDPEYQTFDVKGAGGAQLKIGMKQVIAAKTGGAPQTQDLIVTIRVSRIDNRTAWTIDRVNYALKPK